MQKLIDGIAKFKSADFEERKELFKSLAKGQSPEVLFITCSDSRIDPNLITQTDPGDLFIVRNAGNIVPPHTVPGGGNTASIEFAVQVLGVTDIVICGHTDCGAMKGAMNPDSVKTLPHVANWLGHSAAALARVQARNKCELGAEHIMEMTRENVILQMHHIETHPSVAAKLATGEITLHGWVYDIENGVIECYDKGSETFVPVEKWYENYVSK